MHFLINPEKVLDTLKKCINWKNDNTIKAAKLPLNIFMDFVKLRIIPKNDSAQNAFMSFFKNPQDLKAEGKLEAWIEIGIDIGLEQIPNLEKDLKERYEKVEAFYKSILKEKKLAEEAKTIVVQEVIETPIAEEDDTDQQAEDEREDSIPDNQKPIIVPWDFSDVAQFALEHAILFSKTISGQIFLLHITKTDKEIEQATTDLNAIASETFKKAKIKPKVMVQTGNIFKSITQIANDNHAKFVIMGTHGIKGMQKFTGSFALKVIAGTNTPFIVVQEPPQKSIIREILFPIDNTKENKQKLRQARILARYYKDLKFYLTIPEKISSDHTKHIINKNIGFTTHFFRQNRIEYEVVHVADAENFSEATLKFAAEHQPDLIVILTTKNINFQDYVLGADEQKIIANPTKIPVMCINPIKVSFSGSPTSMTY
jgi:nucleotide-binding universal stress UspA family protein